MTKESIIHRITEEKIIVIVRGIKCEAVIPLAEAMYAGGIRALELTYDASDPDGDAQNAEQIRKLTEHFGDRMMIGAGTVLTTRQVERTKEAGGKFIISPNVNKKVIHRSFKLDLVSIPGALTATEAVKAYEAGADFVKLFPITSLGSSYVKAMRAPLSHIRFLGVGGIDETNMKEYMEAGVCGFGIGSNIVNKKLIEAGDFEGVTELARRYTSQIAIVSKSKEGN